MESRFQNCVSEFDLNLFEQTRNVNQATSLIQQNPVARKLSIARIKDKLKGVSQVVQKAKNSDDISLESQKELLDIKQEQQHMRNLWFEKIEQYKIICEERNKYFNQVAELSKELQDLQNKMKHYSEKEFEVTLKDKIISGYSDQMKGLQNEMDLLLEEKKQREKTSMINLKQAKAHKVMVEKKLTRLLTKYVVPTIKKRDKWLDQIIKKYVREPHKEEKDDENEKLDKNEANEKEDEAISDDEELSSQPIRLRNASSDFDCIGSIDTGRGSSIENSPDYYINHSPLDVAKYICSKCNVSNSDALTSRISPERSHSGDNSTSACKRCTSVEKCDRSTSPIPLERFYVGSTSKESLVCHSSIPEVIITSGIDETSNLEENNSTHENIDKLRQTALAPETTKENQSDCNNSSTRLNEVSKTELFTTTSNILLDFTYSTDDEAEISTGSGSKTANSNEQLNKLTTKDEFVNNQEAGTSCETAAKVQDITRPGSEDSNDSLDHFSDKNTSPIRESPISLHEIEPDLTVESEKAVATYVKLQDEIASDSDDEEVMRDVSPIKESRIFSPIPTIENTAHNNTNDANQHLSATPIELVASCTEVSEQLTDRNSLQDLECRELNSDSNCSNDVDIDVEIRSILQNMQLRHTIITPIPPTPSPQKMRSARVPVDKNNIQREQLAQQVADTMKEQIDQLRSNIQKVFAPVVQDLPQCLEQIVGLFSQNQPNQLLLRNLLCEPISNYENKLSKNNEPCLPSSTTHNNKRQPDVVDLQTDSMLCIEETNENEDSDHMEYTIIEEETETEAHFTNIENRHIQNVVSQENKELAQIERIDDVTNASLMKVEKLSLVAPRHVGVRIDEHLNSNNETKVTHQNTQESFDDNNDQCSNSGIINLDSRKSIVYEGFLSDNDGDMQPSELDNSTENNDATDKTPLKRKGKSKKLTKLETMRIKMLPKSKIKNIEIKPARNLRLKPIPINTVPKKKVTESDTAASLNDKAVYENAVKVISSLRVPKEPRIIIEDCLLFSPEKLKLNADAKNGDENKGNSPKSQSPSSENKGNSPKLQSPSNENKGNSPKLQSPSSDNKGNSLKLQSPSSENKGISSNSQSPSKINTITKTKRKLSETLTNVIEKHSVPNNSIELGEIKKGKRTSVDDKTNESIKNTIQIAHGISRKTSDADIMRSKRARPSSESSEPKTPKRNRTSASECVTSNNKSKHNIEPDSPRILRSSTHVKHERMEHTHTLEIPNVAKCCRRLRSNFDKIEPETFALGRKPRVAKLTHRSTESNKPSTRTSIETELCEKNKGRAVSNRIHDLFSNKDSPDNSGTDDDDIPITDLESKLKIVQQNPQESESKQDDLHIPPTPEITKQHCTAVSYEDLNLFTTDDTTDQSMDQASLVIPDTSGRRHRIARQNSCRTSESMETSKNDKDSSISYADRNLFSNEENIDQNKTNTYRKDSLLCRMIEKYGVKKLKFVAKQIPESKVKEVSKRLETRLSEIVNARHDECQAAMKRLVVEIRTWNVKHFIIGFIQYLKDPQRKIELYKKVIQLPYPPMTKKEQVWIYVLEELQKSWEFRHIINKILDNIEYTLLALNKPAESFDAIESMSHFYALICRCYQKISQLRLFIIDAMYCLQLKSVILVQQCLEVCMSVLPLAHTGLAKSPLVICLVYLLHFYKCEDRFNRVQDIRNTLVRKYNYNMSEWNENKMLHLFRTAITEMKDSGIERKTLRLSLLILAKRHGAKWCHTNIVKNMLQPLITDGATSDQAKRFCVSMLGPLLKPYPSNMKVHSEMVINYLMDMLHRKNTPKMQESIISSLICVDKNNHKLHHFLAKWKPEEVSPEFELVFRDYARSKTVHNWIKIFSWQSH